MVKNYFQIATFIIETAFKKWCFNKTCVDKRKGKSVESVWTLPVILVVFQPFKDI